MTDHMTDGVDEAKVQSTMAPLLRQLGKPTAAAMERQDWITNVLYLAGAQSLDGLNTTLAPDVHDTFYAASTFVSEKDVLRAPSTDALMDYFYTTGAKSRVSWFIILYVRACSLARRRVGQVLTRAG